MNSRQVQNHVSFTLWTPLLIKTGSFSFKGIGMQTHFKSREWAWGFGVDAGSEAWSASSMLIMLSRCESIPKAAKKIAKSSTFTTCSSAVESSKILISRSHSPRSFHSTHLKGGKNNNKLIIDTCDGQDCLNKRCQCPAPNNQSCADFLQLLDY